MRRRGRWIVGGVVVVLGLSAGAGRAQDMPPAKVGCAKPIQPCTACHNAELAQAYAKCLMTRWEGDPGSEGAEAAVPSDARGDPGRQDHLRDLLSRLRARG
jgi:hypothetical protein